MTERSEVRKEERVRELTDLVNQIKEYLIDTKAHKKAEGDEKRTSFRYSTWGELEDKFGLTIYDHSPIIQRADAMNVNIITCSQGVYFSKVAGEKYKSFEMSDKQIAGHARNLSIRLDLLETTGDLKKITERGGQHGFYLQSLTDKLKKLGFPVSIKTSQAILKLTP